MLDEVIRILRVKMKKVLCNNCYYLMKDKLINV